MNLNVAGILPPRSQQPDFHLYNEANISATVSGTLVIANIVPTPPYWLNSVFGLSIQQGRNMTLSFNVSIGSGDSVSFPPQYDETTTTIPPALYLTSTTTSQQGYNISALALQGGNTTSLPTLWATHAPFYGSNDILRSVVKTGEYLYVFIDGGRTENTVAVHSAKNGLLIGSANYSSQGFERQSPSGFGTVCSGTDKAGNTVPILVLPLKDGTIAGFAVGEQLKLAWTISSPASSTTKVTVYNSVMYPSSIQSTDSNFFMSTDAGYFNHDSATGTSLWKYWGPSKYVFPHTAGKAFATNGLPSITKQYFIIDMVSANFTTVVSRESGKSLTTVPWTCLYPSYGCPHGGRRGKAIDIASGPSSSSSSTSSSGIIAATGEASYEGNNRGILRFQWMDPSASGTAPILSKEGVNDGHRYSASSLYSAKTGFLVLSADRTTLSAWNISLVGTP